jgi:hypothetical protein
MKLVASLAGSLMLAKGVDDESLLRFRYINEISRRIVLASAHCHRHLDD